MTPFQFQRAPDSASAGAPSRNIVALRPSFMSSAGQPGLVPPQLQPSNFVGVTSRNLQAPRSTHTIGKSIPRSNLFAHLFSFAVPSSAVHDLVMSGPQAMLFGNVSGIA